jgi:glyoxylase-like metal-dependent hydrolase (beta-lactamase superfamily II)
MKIHTIDTGFFKLDGGAMFGVVPKSIWQKLNPPDANNLCTWAMRCLLVEDGERLMLFDCGLGNKQSEKFFSHYEPHGEDSLAKSLQALGFNEDDVTDVILTHLHFDHCGGAVKMVNDMLVPTFKNATYWSNERHWQWATTPNAREKASFLSENILPIQQSGQLRFVGDDTIIHPQLSFVYVDGHTEQMMLPLIQNGDKKYLFMADLCPSAAHVPLPFVMAYDTRPLLSLSEKKKVFDLCIEQNITLIFEHDKDYAAAILKQDESGKIIVADKSKMITFADL